MTQLTDRQMEDLKFMKSHQAWPMWPALPLKRSSEHELNAGTLWAMDFDGLAFRWLPHINMWDTAKLPRALEANEGEIITPDDFERLLQEGWKVD